MESFDLPFENAQVMDNWRRKIVEETWLTWEVANGH